MKRADCYFGLHFDFHANEWTRDIGEEFDEKIVERICKEVRPDFIQCDTKGHPGYSSYPTKVGNAAPNISRDILMGWRAVTKKTWNIIVRSLFRFVGSKSNEGSSKVGCGSQRW